MIPYDFKVLENVNINVPSIKRMANEVILEASKLSKKEKIEGLIKCIGLVDFTTLAGDDTHVNVERLCNRSMKPLKNKLVHKLINENLVNEKDHLTTASVCVYPARVKDCVKIFNFLNPPKPVNIASVATGFPSGQYGLETKLAEVKQALDDGANEIDMVISRWYALNQNWDKVYNEVNQVKLVCAKYSARLKVILEAGELNSLESIYKASFASMMAGADFIKTSTGKVNINATLPISFVMTRAIWDFNYTYGRKVGFKPAGGIKTGTDALQYMILIKWQLGNEWFQKDLFRFGASSLLNSLEKDLFFLNFGRNADPCEVCL